MIGSLSHLIQGTALDAILDSTERITKALLDTVDLDQAAQASAPTCRQRRSFAVPRHHWGSHDQGVKRPIGPSRAVSGLADRHGDADDRGR